MRLSTAASLMKSGQPSLMFRLLRTSKEFYRAGFVAEAASGGVYAAFRGGSATIDQIAERLDGITNREGLRAWLDMGVSLGELSRSGDAYRITGKLSRGLLDPANDGYRAMLEEIVRHHHRYVMETPGTLRAHARFPFDDAGELIARSSRISEPFIFEAVDEVVPRSGAFDLLEVGCGSGTYIRYSCSRNPDLTALGLELQEKVAEGARRNIAAWGLEGRAVIEHSDVRSYGTDRKFDLVTFHQNIYYFAPADRVALARRALGFLKPGGRVLFTTLGQGGSPAMQAVGIWVATTEGYGPLPEPEEFCGQLREAGFADVRKKRLIPFDSFWAFVGTRPGKG
jgi:SAM-dependent methyltransferase